MSAKPCECGRPLPEVTFDEKAAAGLDADEVRRRWPRGHHNCECGVTTVIYASFSHYVAGDW